MATQNPALSNNILGAKAGGVPPPHKISLSSNGHIN